MTTIQDKFSTFKQDIDTICDALHLNWSINTADELVLLDYYDAVNLNEVAQKIVSTSTYKDALQYDEIVDDACEDVREVIATITDEEQKLGIDDSEGGFTDEDVDNIVHIFEKYGDESPLDVDDAYDLTFQEIALNFSYVYQLFFTNTVMGLKANELYKRIKNNIPSDVPAELALYLVTENETILNKLNSAISPVSHRNAIEKLKTRATAAAFARRDGIIVKSVEFSSNAEDLDEAFYVDRSDHAVESELFTKEDIEDLDPQNVFAIKNGQEYDIYVVTYQGSSIR